MSIKFLNMSSLLERLLNGTQKESHAETINDEKNNDETSEFFCQDDKHDEVKKVVKRKKIIKRK